MADFDHHKAAVGRVEWNVTGYASKLIHVHRLPAIKLIYPRRTVLASSGNDGRVRLWKQAVGGIWRSAGHVSVEQADDQEESPQNADMDMDENAGAD